MIIAIVGPTGVGKTAMSINLAKKYNAIVINADSMQIYKGLDIGTAKVTEKEKENIPHYLFDIKNVEEDYSIYDYQKDLRKILDENKDKNIIMVGGSGLYLKSGLFDYEFSEEKSNNNYDEFDNETLYSKVLEKDSNTLIHPNNRNRMIRFLNRENTPKKVSEKPLYDVLFIGLTTDRETLYEKINSRVDKMIQDGLIEEVKSFYDRNVRSKAIMTGIGYKELYEYFNGNLSLDEAIDLIKKKSRNYAKRQYTWFNNQMNVNWFNVNYDNFDETIEKAIKFIEQKK